MSTPAGRPPSSGGAPGRDPSRNARHTLRTVLDPEAAAILTSLALKPATLAELAGRLGLGTEVVRRDLRRLIRRGQVEPGARVRRRGRLENLYLADPRAIVLDPAELADLPRRRVAAGELALARMMFREAAAAAEAGILERRIDSSLVRYFLPADDLGLRRAVDIHRRLLDAVVEEVTRARERLDRGGVEAIATSVQILCFEHPIERWTRPSDQATIRRSPGACGFERQFEHAADPLRNSIFELLSVLCATIESLAGLLDLPTQKVAYEVGRLLDEGFVKVVGTRSNRGAAERIFSRDVRRSTFSSSDLEASDITTTARWDRWVVRAIFAGALAAIGAETIGEGGSGLYAGRIVAALDDRGFGAIATLTERAMAELADLRDESLEGRPEGELPDHVVLSGLLAFERTAPGMPC